MRPLFWEPKASVLSESPRQKVDAGKLNHAVGAMSLQSGYPNPQGYNRVLSKVATGILGRQKVSGDALAIGHSG
jgi:hypothetical protein